MNINNSLRLYRKDAQVNRREQDPDTSRYFLPSSFTLTGSIVDDAEDNGFAFTRTRAKKAKADAVRANTTEKPNQNDQIESAPTRKLKKKARGSPSATPVEDLRKRTKTRSASYSGDLHENADQPALMVKKRGGGKIAQHLA